jgi:hypothetical protein
MTDVTAVRGPFVTMSSSYVFFLLERLALTLYCMTHSIYLQVLKEYQES